MLRDLLASCFILQTESSNPAKKRQRFADNAGDQQKAEKDSLLKLKNSGTNDKAQGKSGN